MLPLAILNAATSCPMMIELKNGIYFTLPLTLLIFFPSHYPSLNLPGETYNGHLASTDSWMNMSLKQVICTSPCGTVFTKIPEIYIRGNTIKFIRLPEEVIAKVRDEQFQRKGERHASRGGRGRSDGGRGRGDSGRGGRGKNRA